MARYKESVCRLCRREGIKLFLKGTRCYTPKCEIEKRNYPPGQHGFKHPRKTAYNIQLREKQKAIRYYGLLERQFGNYFHKAERAKGITGENLLVLLERRLDNVVQKAGFAISKRQARQLISHGHILVNGKRQNLPSFLLSKGSVLELASKSKSLPLIKENLEGAFQRKVPPWIEVDPQNLTAKLLNLPTKEEIAPIFQEQLIVELYSK